MLDLGCGTGLNFPLLVAAVGPTGRVIGLDRSVDMTGVQYEPEAISRQERVERDGQ